ncbi:MAG: hypothetical protein C4560_03515 [Nitrospiraceae bacterium]|nr:MAG: hypothetical protein C4560_03515 [Nitrospiraceae bacterium]
MLKDEIKTIKSSKSDLRKFGLSVGIVLGLLGGLLWWKEKPYHVYFLAASLFLIFSGLVVPTVLKPLQKAWMTMAVLMGWFMTRVLLIILFYFLITPMSLISKLVGKDFLDRKFSRDHNKNARSYWLTQEEPSNNKRRHETQF